MTQITQAILPPGRTIFFDGNGKLLAAGSVYTYVPETNTPLTTYQDPLGTVPNTNPIVLAADGGAYIYGAGQFRTVVLDAQGATVWDALTYGLVPAGGGGATATTGFGQQLALGSGVTTELGSITTHNALITGNANISSFGSSADLLAPLYYFEAASTCSLVNSGSLSCPTNANINMKAGDGGLAEYQGGGVWKVIAVWPVASWSAGAQTSVVSAGTVDLGAVQSHNALLTGTVAVTGLGNSAVLSNPLFKFEIQSAGLKLTNSGALQCPGGADILSTAGDTGEAEFQGASTWKIRLYNRAAGTALFLPVARGFARTLKVVYAGGNTQGTITADAVQVSSGADLQMSIITALNAVLDISAAGAVNKLDAGAVAASTLYYLFAITDGVTPGVLASLSATAPLLPAGYTQRTRIGAFFTDGSSHIVAGTQLDKGFAYASSVKVINGAAGVVDPTNPTLVAESLAAIVPPTASRYHVTMMSGYSGAGPNGTIVAPNGNYKGWNSTTTPAPLAVPAGTSYNMSDWFPYDSGSVYYCSGGGGGAVFVSGWQDNL